MIWILILMAMVWSGYLVFSYFFVNQAILLMLAPVYPKAEKLFRVIEYGNTHRDLMTIIWIVMIGLLILFQLLVFFRKKEIQINKKIILILILIFSIAALSYPIFSNDIFNYLFAGKTVVYYHQNPFLVMPKTFQDDLWLRFTHYVGNVYYYLGKTPITFVYGPMFLLYTLVPFLFFGAVEFQKLFWSYKLLGAVLFLATGYLFKKINPKDNLVWAYWFLNPFLILELLANSHNDLVMIFLFVLSVYWYQKNKIFGFISFALSVLIKWFSGFLGIVFLFKEKNRYWVYKILGLGILFFHAFYQRYSWYYSWVYMVFPFAKLKKSSWFLLIILQSVLVLNYTEFLWFNRWIYLPIIGVIKWIIPILILLNEFGKILQARVLKLVDKHRSERCVVRHGGSNPSLGTD